MPHRFINGALSVSATAILTSVVLLSHAATHAAR